MKNLNEFDLQIKTDKRLMVGHISELIGNIQLDYEHVVLFKSMKSLSFANENNFSNLIVASIAANN